MPRRKIWFSVTESALDGFTSRVWDSLLLLFPLGMIPGYVTDMMHIKNTLVFIAQGISAQAQAVRRNPVVVAGMLTALSVSLESVVNAAFAKNALVN